MENDLIWGIGELLLGMFFLILVFRNYNLKKDNSYSLSMALRGIVAGAVFIVIGIIQLSRYFGDVPN